MIPVFVADTNVVVTLVGSTKAPFNLSFDNTLVNEVPPTNPFTGDPASSMASITGLVTVTVTVA